jgi:hypothetical protein
MPDQKFPVQPIRGGRFVPNKIVNWMLSQIPDGLNTIARMDFTNEEHMQLAQLIGYTTSGYGSLSYVSDESYQVVCELLDSPEELEKDIRIKVLEDRLKEVETHTRNAAVALFKIHPDDLAL